jgi:dCTP deaminase
MGNPPGRSLLSRPQILRHCEEGNILIEPFDERNLGTASYDIRLGPWFFREHVQRGGSRVFNPLDEEEVRRYWGAPQFAVNAGVWMAKNGTLNNVTPDDLIIVIEPGETILAHSIEFIGGRNCVTTEMRARSTMGRVGMTVCKCAGWGDVGFCNRWTMEMTNVSGQSIVLVVGLRVAQIAFYEVDPIVDTSYACERGKYQTTDDVARMMAEWRPEQLLPRLYADRDIGRFHTFIPEDCRQQAP